MRIYNIHSINIEEMIEQAYIMHVKKWFSYAGSGIETIYEKVLDGYGGNYIFALPKLVTARWSRG